MLRPKGLREGDLVAIVAPSGGLEKDEAPLLERGVEMLERMGFAVRVSPLVDLEQSWWWAAAAPAEIAEEFNRHLRDPEVRAIFSLTGGRMTLSYLDRIDFGAIRADPKPVLGMSDISALHLVLHARTGLVSLHSDLVTVGFGDWSEIDDTRRDQLLDLYRRVLTEDAPLGPLPPGGSWASWRSGRAEGPLIGGMLNRLVRVQATSLALAPERFDGAILFWEEAFTSTSVVWNDLHVLRQAGVLDRISGMIVGTPFEVEPTPPGPDTLRDIVLEVVGDRDIPVLGDVDIGHAGPNLPIPLGVRAEMDADARTLSLLEPVVTASDGSGDVPR
jgi:muramoyltetrapeptide carboxypeptidase LdcA involved in peptidoglycan recycling